MNIDQIEVPRLYVSRNSGLPVMISDLPRNQRSGLQKASRILKNIDGIAHIELDEDDVVRHRLVKSILRAYDKERKEEENRGEIK